MYSGKYEQKAGSEVEILITEWYELEAFPLDERKFKAEHVYNTYTKL